MHNPLKVHYQLLKRLPHYLQDTITNGLLITHGNLQLLAYFDLNLARIRHIENPLPIIVCCLDKTFIS